MNKQEFLSALRKALSGLPNEDIEERLNFYSEMIEDRIEEGLSEEDAVSQIGPVEEIVSQTIVDIPLGKLIKERIAPNRKWNSWEIGLLVVGAPIWLSLLIAAFSVTLSLYVSFWAVIISFWAAFVSFIAAAVGGVVMCITYLCVGNVTGGFFMLGAGSVCAGLSVFTYFACQAMTKGTAWLTKKAALRVKSAFMKKEVEE